MHYIEKIVQLVHIKFLNNFLSQFKLYNNLNYFIGHSSSTMTRHADNVNESVLRERKQSVFILMLNIQSAC